MTLYATWNAGNKTTTTVTTSITFPAIPSHATTTATTTRTVNYNANGGTGTTTAQSVSPTATVSYSANKWWTAQSSGTSYIVGANITPTSSSTYYARYTASTGTYSSPTIALRSALTFASVSTTTTTTLTTSFSAASSVAAITSTKTVTSTQPKTFDKWRLGSTTGTSYSAGETFTPTTGSTTFYATSKNNGTATNVTTYSNITLPNVPAKSNTTDTITRTVTFDRNGSTSATPTSQAVSPTATVTWSDDDKWYTASSGGTAFAQGLTTYAPTASATLYAHYTASTGTYSSPTIALPAALAFADVVTSSTTTATLNFSAASSVNALTTTKTVVSTQPKTFDSWKLGSTSGTAYSAGETFTPTTGTTTFYATSKNNGSATSVTTYGAVTLPNVPAKSDGISTITRAVYYDANGGTASSVSSFVNPTATVTYTDDDKWYTASSGGTGTSQGSNYTLTADNATLYAHYTASTGTYSSPTISLPSATNGNKIFNGWYDGNIRVGGSGSTYTPTVSQVTLLAQWSDGDGWYNGHRCCYVFNGNLWKKAVPYIFLTNINRYSCTGTNVYRRTGPGTSYPWDALLQIGDLLYSDGTTATGEGYTWLRTLGGHYVAMNYVQQQGTVAAWFATEPHVFVSGVWQ